MSCTHASGAQKLRGTVRILGVWHAKKAAGLNPLYEKTRQPLIGSEVAYGFVKPEAWEGSRIWDPGDLNGGKTEKHARTLTTTDDTRRPGRTRSRHDTKHRTRSYTLTAPPTRHHTTPLLRSIPGRGT